MAIIEAEGVISVPVRLVAKDVLSMTDAELFDYVKKQQTLYGSGRERQVRKPRSSASSTTDKKAPKDVFNDEEVL